MPDGGAWKELLKASEEGNLKLVEYNLSVGIDPNFQHPEFFTAPIFEAVRNGHLDVVRLLVERGGADPDLVEEMTDSSPLEVAMEERKHEIVDYLITKLTDEQVSAIVRTFVVTGVTVIGSTDEPYRNADRDDCVLKRILHSGHRLVILTDEKQDAVRTTSLKRETGNVKLDWSQELNDKVPHIWICLNDVDKETNKVLAKTPRKIIVTPCQKSTNKDCITIVTPDCALWYNRWTQSWWLPALMETVWWAVMTTDWDEVKGKLFDHRKTHL